MFKLESNIWVSFLLIFAFMVNFAYASESDKDFYSYVNITEDGNIIRKVDVKESETTNGTNIAILMPAYSSISGSEEKIKNSVKSLVSHIFADSANSTKYKVSVLAYGSEVVELIGLSNNVIAINSAIDNYTLEGSEIINAHQAFIKASQSLKADGYDKKLRVFFITNKIPNSALDIASYGAYYNELYFELSPEGTLETNGYEYISKTLIPEDDVDVAKTLDNAEGLITGVKGYGKILVDGEEKVARVDPVNQTRSFLKMNSLSSRTVHDLEIKTFLVEPDNIDLGQLTKIYKITRPSIVSYTDLGVSLAEYFDDFHKYNKASMVQVYTDKDFKITDDPIDSQYIKDSTKTSDTLMERSENLFKYKVEGLNGVMRYIYTTKPTENIPRKVPFDYSKLFKKKIVGPDSNGEYTVTIEASSKNKTKDIVLAIDSSGIGYPLNNGVKKWVKEFIDGVLKENHENRIALISYVINVRDVLLFTSDKNELYEFVDNILSDGLGNNPQVAIHWAGMLLNGPLSISDEKHMVVHINSTPNSSYDILAYYPLDVSGYYYRNADFVHEANSSKHRETIGSYRPIEYFPKEDLAYDNFNYNAIISTNEDVGPFEDIYTVTDHRQILEDNFYTVIPGKYGTIDPIWAAKKEKDGLGGEFKTHLVVEDLNFPDTEDDLSTALNPNTFIGLSTPPNEKSNILKSGVEKLENIQVRLKDDIDPRFSIVPSSIIKTDGDNSTSNFSVDTTKDVISWDIDDLANSKIEYKLKLKNADTLGKIPTSESVWAEIKGKKYNLQKTEVSTKQITYKDGLSSINSIHGKGLIVSLKTPEELGISSNGRTFEGWYEGSSKKPNSFILNDNVVLIAKWSPGFPSTPKKPIDTPDSPKKPNDGFQEYNPPKDKPKPNEESPKESESIVITPISKGNGQILGGPVSVKKGVKWLEIAKRFAVRPDKEYYFLSWVNNEGKKINNGYVFNESQNIYAIFQKLPENPNGKGGYIPYNPEDIIHFPEGGEQIIYGILNYDDFFAYLEGYKDGSIRAEDFIKRDEVAAIFFRLLDKTYRNNIRKNTNEYLDVKDSRWSNKHISTLTNGQILEGYPNGSFKPFNFITRAELAVVASKFDKLDLTAEHTFTDLKGHWAERYIASAVSKGWINGYEDKTFKPDNYITRAELASLVNNVLKRNVNTKEILKEVRTFTDLKNWKWYFGDIITASNSYISNERKDGYQVWLKIIYPDIEM